MKGFKLVDKPTPKPKRPEGMPTRRELRQGAIEAQMILRGTKPGAREISAAAKRG